MWVQSAVAELADGKRRERRMRVAPGARDRRGEDSRADHSLLPDPTRCVHHRSGELASLRGL